MLLVEFNILLTFAQLGVVVNKTAESFTQFPVLLVEKIYPPLGCNAKLSVTFIENNVIAPANVLFVEFSEYVGVSKSAELPGPS